jgi:hypothetical protein
MIEMCRRGPALLNKAAPIAAGLLAIASFALGGCSTDQGAAAPAFKLVQPDASPAFAYWGQQFPGHEWVRLGEADLDGDGREDLLVIYRDTSDKCSFCVILNLVDGPKATESVSAPAEEQVMNAFEMDGKPPCEFSVSGRKGADIGSAVFRLENAKITQLFSTGYGKCC